MTPKAQSALERVIARFESGDLSPLIDAALFKPPAYWPAAAWSFGNRVLAFAQADSLHCRGFRQWQDVGRHVIKGGQAVFIWAPLTYTAENTDGEKETRVRGFRPIAIFPADQTDGDTPLKELEPDLTPVELPPLMDVAAKLGVDIRYTPTPGDRKGDYTPGQNRIRLSTDDTKTFFHELAHATHDRINGLEGSQAEKEAIAEFTATVLMELYDLGDRSGNCWSYIHMYAKDPLVAIMKAMSTIEAVLSLITAL